MADYWKSQPRKFCQYCKCWIADNKPSIDFHERGKNHKENVAAKIAEIKKKSIAKAKQDERMTKQFAAMEEAAMKAYEEDLKRMQMEAAGISLPYRAPAQPPPQFQPKPKPQPKKHQKKGGGKGNRQPREQAPVQVWVEGMTEDGQTYYYNTVTGESQWEKPEGYQGQSSASAQPVQNESSSGCVWMEALSPEGYTYYYNTETGESSWEKPADFPSDEASKTNKDGEEDESQEEAAAPEPEQTSAGEESSDVAPASQQAEAPEQGSQQATIPKISFRKRKAEETDPAEKEQDDKTSDDAPEKGDEEMKKEEEVQGAPAEPQKPEERVEQTQRVTQAKRQRAANPYGVWEQIQQEVDPYEKVDLQLPQVEESTSTVPADLPPEPKPKFKERIITSLGEEGGSATFRKNKTQNGKSRSLRQRNDDD